MKNLVLISLLFTGLFYACKTSKDAATVGSNTDIISITHGTSFGMCRGYCIHEEEYTMNEAIISHKSWDTTRNKPMIKKITFSQTDFNSLASLLNKKEWEKLEERIGCPDCTDRGSEYVIIKTASGTKKVTFDAHSDVPAIAELLARLRKYKRDFEYDPNLEDK